MSESLDGGSRREIGARFNALTKKSTFRVWAPHAKKLFVHIVSPLTKKIPMRLDSQGYWSCQEVVPAGATYYYFSPSFGNKPDPASSFQPDGVHGPSQVVDLTRYQWRDKNWRVPAFSKWIIYELHVGTFTREGTFAAARERLDDLADLGINAIELMPLAQFPGNRNWGYDGVCLFAPQNSYGAVEEVQRFVDEAHARGIAVILDVVYNHLGPEGNYLACFGPYFTGKYLTPWGSAVNFDDAYCGEVRNFFVQNALYWLEHFHVDGLRLDAVHAMVDMSARPFLLELQEAVTAFGKRQGKVIPLIGESDLNDARLLRPWAQGGLGLTAQWSDDFHHALHAILTKETNGYYRDFGKVADLAKALEASFVYDGKYSIFRKKPHGNSVRQLPGDRFVVSLQTHDQVGNRMQGERFSSLVSFSAAKLGAAVLLCSPYVPMLFMGEEYLETAPFQYFVSHHDAGLIEAVRRGRTEEFKSFSWKGKVPDPQSEKTFENSKLNWALRQQGTHAVLLALYRQLIFLRKKHALLREPKREAQKVFYDEDAQTLSLVRERAGAVMFLAINFSRKRRYLVSPRICLRATRLLDTSDLNWRGPGSVSPKILEAKIPINPMACLVYYREDTSVRKRRKRE